MVTGCLISLFEDDEVEITWLKLEHRRLNLALTGENAVVCVERVLEVKRWKSDDTIRGNDTCVYPR